MNGIIGMTDLVLDSELTPDQRDELGTVRSSADSLLSILNDILDFSKIEARKLDLESIAFAPRTILADVLKPFAMRAQQKGLELVSECDADVPVVVIGDPVRFQQIVGNLVGNAIKFTEHGHVLVGVREDAHTEGSTRLHVSVTDTGIGIPKDKQAAVFEAFQQADGSTTRRFGGTGLGLTISATLAGLMGGRLWADSEPGVGSTFHFTVALDVAALSRARPAGTGPGGPATVPVDGAGRATRGRRRPDAAAGAPGGRQRGQSAGRERPARTPRPPRHRRGKRRRRARNAGARALRHRADGRADAGHGRPRSHRRHSQAGTGHGPPRAHRRDDRPCDEGRSRALPGVGHGRVSHQAAPAGKAVCRGRTPGRRRARSAGDRGRAPATVFDQTLSWRGCQETAC